MDARVVIPARFASTRLPRKMLLAETGWPLVRHTYEAACRAKRPRGVVVATDHVEIAAEVKRFEGSVVMTSPDCASGSDRVAEVARLLPEADVLVNVQGDEPEIDPGAIDRVIELLEADPSAPMATLATPLRDADRVLDPACVKVVFDHRGHAMYFSRSPIPLARDEATPPVEHEPPLYHLHLGIYAYRRDFLLQLAALPPSPLEQAEKLEQLRVLQAGQPIAIGVVDHGATGIDTPEDYTAFVERWSARKNAA